ncbi:hypothetical protein ACFV3R_25255 [Streptomyces sp. NPDC059740]|uniref:hypothetical protein n=1 Tax=Streptomyces sp. NPDC059740 TaxID=3346926 RepID=UPI003667E34E
MIELLLLAAIAYAGARGVESLAGTTDRRHRDKTAEKTVIDLAKGGDKTARMPGPTEKGGTFSNAAPRSSALGGKAAVPLATLTETGATMWGAILEGYRTRWPEIRAERRQHMAERAERRKAEREKTAAERRAAEAVAKAGPPPSYPPAPAEMPKTEPAAEPVAVEETKEPAAAVPGPRTSDEDRIAAAEKRAAAAEERARTAEREAANAKVLAAQKEAREAKEREAAAQERARAAEARAAEDRTHQPDSAGETPAGRPHLTLVPTLDKTGVDMASSPHTLIPEVRTLDGLLNTLALVRAMAEMRAEEAAAIAGDDLALSNRLDEIETGLTAEDVDPATLADLAELRESIANQSKAATSYSGTAKDSADIAQAVAEAAHKAHGGIAEAIQSSPIEKAAQAGYYNR